MKKVLLTLLFLSLTGAAQVAPGVAPAYQPKFAGDKARSEAEFSALGYMRTVVAAEKVFHRKHDKYAGSLHDLIGSSSFTRRMTNPNRGDYAVNYRSLPDGYTLTLTPRQFDAAHRAFYVDQTGDFRAEESHPANKTSPPL